MEHQDLKEITTVELEQVMLLEERFLKFTFKLVLKQVLILLEQMLK